MGIREIATKADVSIATISRVLNTPEKVKRETREKVLKILKESEYKKFNYNYNYNTDISKGQDEIGVVIPSVVDSYFARILEGISKQAQKLNLSLILHITHDEPEEELNAINKLIEKQIRGVILIRVKDREESSLKVIQKLNKYDVPFVIIDRDISTSDYSGVFLSNANSVYDSINLLIEGGYLKIAFITGVEHNLNSKQRLNGYKEALIKNNIEVDDSLIKYGDFSIQSGLDCTKEFLSKDNLPDAIFSCSNNITIGCIKAITQKGLVLGKDIKLFSFNKLDDSYINNFDISYIEHPVKYMGEKSVIILKNKLVGTKGTIREIMGYKINY